MALRFATRPAMCGWRQGRAWSRSLACSSDAARGRFGAVSGRRRPVLDTERSGNPANARECARPRQRLRRLPSRWTTNCHGDCRHRNVHRGGVGRLLAMTTVGRTRMSGGLLNNAALTSTDRYVLRQDPGGGPTISSTATRRSFPSTQMVSTISSMSQSPSPRVKNRTLVALG